MHGEQLIEDDVYSTSNRVFHHRLVQDGALEGHGHALRENSAGHGISIGLWYLAAIDQKRGALAQDRTNIGLGDWKDGDILSLNVREEGNQAIL